MRSLDDCVLTAMDCKDRELLPYLPYILQDFWEIGSEPEVMMPPAQSEADHQLEELAAAHAELADENAKLLDKLAVQSMDATPEEKAAAANTLEDLRMQVKTLDAELRAVKNSRDQLQAKNADMMKQISYWKKRAEKAEQATEKVAA